MSLFIYTGVVSAEDVIDALVVSDGLSSDERLVVSLLKRYICECSQRGKPHVCTYYAMYYSTPIMCIHCVSAWSYLITM